jgi:hypothetical protein
MTLLERTSGLEILRMTTFVAAQSPATHGRSMPIRCLHSAGEISPNHQLCSVTSDTEMDCQAARDTESADGNEKCFGIVMRDAQHNSI